MSLQHNTYFDGGVQSIGYEREGARQSVGVMAAGEYHFGTDAPERMTVVSGELVVKLPGSDDWQAFGSGTSFDVPGVERLRPPGRQQHRLPLRVPLS
ncbi:MAG TPA: pyrimidine/purine nucleoside phosphorylase [Acidimicrobiales bacterium]|nr:pyrimidine/purine nucleoside phosphorylase [Acidimicrobiales bacterium]